MDNRYGRYEVLQQLGQGAMAEVHLARDPVLSRFVAIKVLHAELATRKDVIQRFFNEARTVAVVRNPHVVEIFDFGQQGKDLYLVMEFVDGPSLQDILKQLRPPTGHFEASHDIWSSLGRKEDQYIVSEPLEATVAASILCQAAEGLILAAQNGVVHRDIKPENMLINRQGYLKISDFGIAHIQDDSLTKTGAILGSPLFMSPEQTRGLKPITYQADIFSLGAVLYTCLAGHPPFKGKNLADLFRKIATEPHIPLAQLRSDLGPNLLHLTETLLQKDPKYRGDGPKWLHGQLKNYLMGKGISDPAERLSEYMQDLSDRGIRTGWKSNGLGTTMASTRDTYRSTRSEKHKMALPVPAAILIGLVMFAGGLWYGMGHKVRSSQAQLSAEVASTVKVAPISAALNTDDVGSIPDAKYKADTTIKPPQVLSQPKESVSRSAAPSEENATLILKSSPPFAEAFLDGQFIGITPVQVELPVAERHRYLVKGKHALTADTVMALKSGLDSVKFKLHFIQPARLAETQEGEGP